MTWTMKLGKIAVQSHDAKVDCTCLTCSQKFLTLMQPLPADLIVMCTCMRAGMYIHELGHVFLGAHD